MSTTSNTAASSVGKESAISDREIGTLFLPLAITSTMMSISVPVINAGLTRLPDAVPNLAAFGLAFSLSIFLESPVFALQQAIVAWYDGKGGVGRYVGFAAGVGLVMMLVVASVAFTPLAPFLFRVLMGAPEHLVEPAVNALKVAMVFPPLVASRLGFQGILIARRNGAPIAWGTFLRLLLLSALVFLVCPRLPMEAPAAAMFALAAAVLVELLYVAHATLRTPDRPVPFSKAQESGKRLSGRVLFLLPLAGTMALGTLTNPFIISFISRTSQPETALAGYAVVSSLVWFLASSTLRFSAVTIALGTTPENLKKLVWFLWRVVGGMSVIIILVNVTPVIGVILEDLVGLTPALAASARLPLLLLSLQPLAAAFIAYNQGVLTRNARTGWVGVGSLSRVVAIVTGGILGLAIGVDGILLGGLLLGASFAGELVTLILVRQAGRRRVAKLESGPGGSPS